MSRQISVIGASEGSEEILRVAEAVGRGIAEAGAVLVCGGRTGVMEAASKGAAEAGGIVIGVLPTLSPDDANPYVTHAVATGTGHARNLAVVASGDAVIAIGGEWGTLSEIAFARRLGTRDRDSELGAPQPGRHRPRDRRGRDARGRGGDRPFQLGGYRARRARIAKACDQASGVVEVGAPVRASTRSGSVPSGVSALWSSASSRSAAVVSPSFTSAHADHAVGAVQTWPGVQPSIGGMPNRVESRAIVNSVRRAAGNSSGRGKTVTAQAAAESSCVPPCSRTRPRGDRNRRSISLVGAPAAIALPRRSPVTFSP